MIQGTGLTILRAKTQAELRREAALAAGRYVITERLCVTPDGRLVTEDLCVDGGRLLYRPGDEIPLAEARERGLIAPEVPVAVALPETGPQTNIVEERPRRRGR